MKGRIDIVVPCFNEEEALPGSARRLLDLLESEVSAGHAGPSSRVIFIDDGSSDRTWEVIRALSVADPRVAGIRLTRNRGHQVALLAGLLESDADAAISIDADLQDDIRAIPEMLRHWHGGCEVVYGVRDNRDSDTPFKRVTARAYYWLLRALGVELVEQHGDFRLLGRRALDCLREYREVNLFLRGLVPQLGFRTAKVHYARSERRAGQSKYPLRRMLALALNGVTSFSAAPLRVAAGLGMLAFLLSLGMTIWVLWIRFFADSAVPGWASTVIPMYFLGGVQLLSIGIVGEYLARVFTEVKQRPRYFIETRVGAGFESTTAAGRPGAGGSADLAAR
jgi:glycosyltransferase involved in cell wall biosynthesis